jgi:hypothetical protein
LTVTRSSVIERCVFETFAVDLGPRRAGVGAQRRFAERDLTDGDEVDIGTVSVTFGRAVVGLVRAVLRTELVTRVVTGVIVAASARADREHRRE